MHKNNLSQSCRENDNRTHFSNNPQYSPPASVESCLRRRPPFEPSFRHSWHRCCPRPQTPRLTASLHSRRPPSCQENPHPSRAAAPRIGGTPSQTHPRHRCCLRLPPAHNERGREPAAPQPKPPCEGRCQTVLSAVNPRGGRHLQGKRPLKASSCAPVAAAGFAVIRFVHVETRSALVGELFR